MKLSFEDIKSITSGAERIAENDGIIEFRRFSEGEEEAYRESWLSQRTLATSGVKLHFTTDAEKLIMKTRVTEIGYHTLYAFDVYADKKFVGQIRNYPDGTGRGDREKNKYPIGEKIGCFTLEKGEKEIEIYFPWSVKGELLELELSGATFFEPVKTDKVCLIYGDSITQGATALSPSNAYAIKLSDWLSAECYNKAIGSEMYFPELVKAGSGNISPDYIFVSYGLNDWVLRTYDEAEEKCREFWKNVCEAYPGAKKFVLTPIWYENKNIEKKMGAFELIEKFIRKVAAEFPEITILDCTDFLPPNPELFDDGVHPTDEGFRYYFEGLKKQLETLL